MVSGAIVALYFWTYFEKAPVGETLIVNNIAVIIAGLTAAICFISYLWIPKKAIFPVSLTIYLLSVATVGTLVQTTGGVTSPFIALWMLVGVFAGIFGVWGLLPILLAVSVFIANQYLTTKLTNSVLIIAIFSSILPLIASFIVWHSKSDRDEDESDDKSYKNLANELTEVSSKSEVVINAIGDGVIAVDYQGVVQLINPAAQNLIGWTKQDAVGLSYKSILRLVDKEDNSLDPGIDPINQALNSNQEMRSNDLILLTKSDKKINISLVTSPVGDPGAGVITVFRDITKEKAEEREQAEFISTASHEMRTPIASIEGYLGLALNPQTATIDDRARDYLNKAHSSSEHLGRLFQDLLDVSKSEDGRMTNKPRVVNIVTFVHEIIGDLKDKAVAKGLILNYKPLPDDPHEKHVAPAYSVNLDNDHIREILNNLIENAIKYTNKGEVVVDVNGDEEHVTISVKDSGIGIPSEDMPHLFQKFYRVDNKDTREIGGTGLGLYLSRRLTEMMGGRIWAESVYGSGSTFYVELPRISNADAATLLNQQQTEETSAIEAQPVSPPAPQPAQPATPVQPPKSTEHAFSVPRSQALTPQQIAEYVAKQRALAAQQQQLSPATSAPAAQTAPPKPAVAAAPAQPRLNTVNIPTRGHPRLIQ